MEKASMNRSTIDGDQTGPTERAELEDVKLKRAAGTPGRRQMQKILWKHDYFFRGC